MVSSWLMRRRMDDTQSLCFPLRLLFFSGVDFFFSELLNAPLDGCEALFLWAGEGVKQNPPCLYVLEIIFPGWREFV